MTAAYAYHLNAASPAVQSGRPHSILHSFRQLGLEVEELFPLAQTHLWPRNLKKIRRRLLLKNYLLDRDEALLRGFAQQLQDWLPQTNADFVFSPSTLPLSYLETDLPVTFCADAPFCAMMDYYDSFTHLSAHQIDLSEKLEAEVVSRAALAVYPSQWAADYAIKSYGANPAKVAVIPFGANFGCDNQRSEVESWIEQRAGGQPVRLLFVGRDWERKGGDIVVTTAAWLRAKGLAVQVDLVGCSVPLRHRHLDYLHAHGALSPSIPLEAEALTRLFRQAHLLFVPSRAEAYGMIFCEANAFGIPAISTETGGISGVVRSGMNGHILPLEACAEDYGRVILQIMDSKESYVSLAQRSFQEFEQRLNWKDFSRNFLEKFDSTKSADPILQAGSHPPPSPPAPIELRSLQPLPEPPEEELPSPAAPLRVAFVANEYFDPRQVGAWSGLPHFVWHSLEQQGLQIQLISLDSGRHAWWRWVKFAVAKMFAGRRYLRDRDTALLRSYARQIERVLAEQEFDFLFCPGTAPIAYVETKVPMAFWVDASFAGMTDFYGSFTRLSKVSIEEGHTSDQAAIERAALAIYSSDWAAESARRAYRVDPARLHVVRYGANLRNAPTTAEIHEVIRQRARDICRLLFVGVDWKRKGGDEAVAALRALESLGVKAHLTIVGCTPPAGTDLPENVKVVGFISKSTAAGQALIERHFLEAHLFLLPTHAEAYGLVFCEASAYGLPCVASRVGGISSIVENGVNGWLLPAGASAEAYALRIQEIWKDETGYENYARHGRRLYDERLNWAVAGREVAGMMRRRHAEKSPRPA